MKLSETLLESLNDIDAVYLEKSEKEYGWLYRYRRQVTAVLSLSAVLVLSLLILPGHQNMDAGSSGAAPAENVQESMKQEDSYDVTETEGAAGIEMRSYMLVLQDENGNVADEAIRREVYETLKEAGYDIYYDECGELIVRGDPEELKTYLEQLKYSYELIEQ